MNMSRLHIGHATADLSRDRSSRAMHIHLAKSNTWESGFAALPPLMFRCVWKMPAHCTTRKPACLNSSHRRLTDAACTWFDDVFSNQYELTVPRRCVLIAQSNDWLEDARSLNVRQVEIYVIDTVLWLDSNVNTLFLQSSRFSHVMRSAAHGSLSVGQQLQLSEFEEYRMVVVSIQS